MRHTKQSAFVCAAVLGASLTAFAQDEPRERARNANPVRAAQEALGLTQDQVNRIREIRRARPPRDQDHGEFREWRKQQQSKLQGVLNEDQKAKLADLEAARGKMRALMGASFLGLTEGQRPDRESLRQRSKGMRGSRGFRGAPRRFPGFQGRGPRGRGPNPLLRGGFRRGPNRFNRGRGFGAGPGSCSRSRGRRARNRD